jgi:hypothetical protein
LKSWIGYARYRATIQCALRGSTIRASVSSLDAPAKVESSNTPCLSSRTLLPQASCRHGAGNETLIVPLPPSRTSSITLRCDCSHRRASRTVTKTAKAAARKMSPMRTMIAQHRVSAPRSPLRRRFSQLKHVRQVLRLSTVSASAVDRQSAPRHQLSEGRDWQLCGGLLLRGGGLAYCAVAFTRRDSDSSSPAKIAARRQCLQRQRDRC